MKSNFSDEKNAENVEKKLGENPTISDNSGQLIQLDDHVDPSTIIRAYSPIIEDPRERDSRPPSTDPLADSISIPSRTMTPSLPSRASSPLPGSSSKTEVKDQEKDESKDDSNQTKEESNDKSIVEAKPEPIFRPLITEKGKSKTTGKNIGGWI